MGSTTLSGSRQRWFKKGIYFRQRKDNNGPDWFKYNSKSVRAIGKMLFRRSGRSCQRTRYNSFVEKVGIIFVGNMGLLENWVEHKTLITLSDTWRKRPNRWRLSHRMGKTNLQEENCWKQGRYTKLDGKCEINALSGI